MRQLGWPPILYVEPELFEQYARWSIGDDWGGAETVRRVRIYSIHRDAQGVVRENMHWHEIGHHLWEWRPDWWIRFFALKMARGGGIGPTEWMNGHDISELPRRPVLLAMAIRQAERLKLCAPR
jgi:hypothetical protein